MTSNECLGVFGDLSKGFMNDDLLDLLCEQISAPVKPIKSCAEEVTAMIRNKQRVNIFFIYKI